MNLYFLRHGESEANAAGLIGGDDPGLTVKGRQEARAAAPLVAQIKPDAIYVSTMKRARETAEIIAREMQMDLNGLIYDDRIVERGMGSAANMLRSDTGWVSSTVPDTVEGVEKISDLFVRAREFLEDIEQKHLNETVLLISHGVTIKAMLAILGGEEWDTMKAQLLKRATPFQSFEEAHDDTRPS